MIGTTSRRGHNHTWFQFQLSFVWDEANRFTYWVTLCGNHVRAEEDIINDSKIAPCKGCLQAFTAITGDMLALQKTGRV